MAATRMILEAKGKEDTYLTKDSSHSYFKDTNKTHTYFGQNWNIVYPTKDFLFDQTTQTVLTLPIEGDLISKMVLRLNVKDVAEGSYRALEYLDSVTFKYNDQVLSTLDANYIAIFHKLNSSHTEYKKFVDMTSLSSQESLENSLIHTNQTDKTNTLYIPLPFWFTKNPGSSFPIYLLSKPRLTIEIKLKKTTEIKNLDLLVQYTNLTSKEKDVFNNSSLEYLIEQVDIANKIDFVDKTNVKIELPRTKYLKYMIWNILDTTPANDFSSKNYIEKSTILLNGNPVIYQVDKNRTALINRYNYFNTPYVNGFVFDRSFLDPNGVTINNTYKRYVDTNDLNIHTQNFCLDPEKFQSSGFLTTDKFNNFTLEIDTLGTNRTGTLHTYLIRHNILRFKNGILNLMHN